MSSHKFFLVSVLICGLAILVSSCAPKTKWNSGLTMDTVPGRTHIGAYSIPASFDTVPGFSALPHDPVLQIVFDPGVLDSTDTLKYVSYMPGQDSCSPAPSGEVVIYEDLSPPAPPAPVPAMPVNPLKLQTLTNIGSTFVFPTNPSVRYYVALLAVPPLPIGPPCYPMNTINYIPGLMGTYDGYYCTNKLEITIN